MSHEAQTQAVDKFFATLLSNLLRHMDLPSQDPNVKTPLLLASPGFTAASFLAYIKEQAVKTGDKQLMSFVPSILTAHSSSAHMHSLGEVLSSPALKSKLADTKYSRESALMDRFFDLLRRDDARAWYGPREVERAVAQGAVGRGGGVLLISNLLFRASEVGERKRWVSLVDKVRQEHGGEVRVLSSLHESGKRLEGLGNVAAILTYPIEGLDEDGNEDEGGEQEVDGGGNKNLDDI